MRSGINQMNFYRLLRLHRETNKVMDLRKIKKIALMLVCCVVMLGGACTSGEKSPVDSHPGSGSVKEDAAPEDSTARDTTKKDSAQSTP